MQNFEIKDKQYKNNKEKIAELINYLTEGKERAAVNSNGTAVVGTSSINGLQGIPKNIKPMGSSFFIKNEDETVDFVQFENASLQEVVQEEIKGLNKGIYFKYNSKYSYFETSEIQNLKLPKDVSLTYVELKLCLKIIIPKINSFVISPLIKVK